MSHHSAKKTFNPEAWILTHDVASYVAEDQRSLPHYAKQNSLLNFMQQHDLLKIVPLDKLEDTVGACAAHPIHVFRFDRLTLFQKLSAAGLSAKFRIPVQETRGNSLSTVVTLVAPDRSFLEALSTNVKLAPSPLLEEYVGAVGKWAMEQFTYDPKTFKQTYRPLYAMIEKRPGQLEAITADILTTVTGQQAQLGGAAGAAAPFTQRSGGSTQAGRNGGR